jgi:hypothetical protein
MARAFPRDYRRPSQMRVDKHAPSLYLSTAKTIDPLDWMSLYTFFELSEFPQQDCPPQPDRLRFRRRLLILKEV